MLKLVLIGGNYPALVDESLERVHEFPWKGDRESTIEYAKQQFEIYKKTGKIAQDRIDPKYRLKILQAEAIEACEFRGHTMKPWSKPEPGGLTDSWRSSTECSKCGKWVQVYVNPMPNGIDIGGPAVAVNCEPS